jgi:site-specific recombinase XerD
MERDSGVPLVKDVRMSGEMVSKYSVSLTLEEVDKIRQLKLDSDTTLFHIRNMMVLMTLTGLRFSEWELIRPELFREPYQMIVSPKTGKSCLLIHRDEVRTILSQYEKTGIPKCVLTNQVVNRGVKEVSKLSGLTRMVHKTLTRDGIDYHEPVPLYSIVSTHTLRRTKITLDLNQGRSMRDIVLETGQSEEVVRKHYDRRNIDDYVSHLGVTRVE